MIDSVTTKLQEIKSAVDGVTFTVDSTTFTAQAYNDPGANVNVPAVVFGLPTLAFEAYSNSEPTGFELALHLVIKSDGYIVPTMEPFITAVTAAIYDKTQDVVVTQAIPGVFVMGTTELPAYVLTVEV